MSDGRPMAQRAGSTEIGREGGQGFKKVMIVGILVLVGRTGIAKRVGYI